MPAIAPMPMPSPRLTAETWAVRLFTDFSAAASEAATAWLPDAGGIAMPGCMAEINAEVSSP